MATVEAMSPRPSSDDSLDELDIDGDGKSDDAADELDIDGDTRLDDSVTELDIDGDNRKDDSVDELDIDGDGKNDDDLAEDDVDGDGKDDDLDDDEDGDGRKGGTDNDDDGDGKDDDDDDDDGVVVIPPGQVAGGTAPASLTGTLRLSKNTTEGPDVVTFTSSTVGIMDEADEVENDAFTFTYTPTGSTAVLVLTYKPGKYDEYTLDFATGRFTRKEYDKNVLKDTDFGSFDIPVPPAS